MVPSSLSDELRERMRLVYPTCVFMYGAIAQIIHILKKL